MVKDQQLDEKAIFSAALSLESADARQDYLKSACGTNTELFQQVSRLLELEAESPSYLEAPATGLVAMCAMSPPIEQVGTTIGRYKVLEQIGEGGMGVVFVAEQTEPVRRRVALKIIKPGMDTRQVIARFGAERQALALMDHPNIAKVLDAGATEAGRPYFVMELVRGMPITDYCDESRLDLQGRLGLFKTACLAVQHAHQKGVIHRDIKPSNVLITLHDGQPVVKVIDFGVAKAINQHLTEQTIYTAFTEMVGTPLYMSPEQAELSDLDIDTRSDVYSLGVLLYELLTGNTPFDRETLAKKGLDEIRKMLREDEPPRPSHRISTLKAEAISTLSQSRGIDQRQLSHVLKGELDWIVMKALEKDRNRRYESPSTFAADVERYLNNEPVAAGPPSHLYRVRKFVRRNRTIVTSVSLVLILAAVGLTTSLVAISRERTAVIAASSEANANFQIAREAIDRLMTKVAQESLLNQPKMQTLRRSLLNDALEFYQKLIAQRGDDSDLNKELALAYARVGKILEQQGELLKSVEPQRESVRRLRLLVATDDDPKVRLELVKALDGLGSKLQKLALRPDYDDEESKELMQEALAVVEPLYERHPEDSKIGAQYGRLLINYAYDHRDDLGRIRLEQAVEVAEALVRRSPDNSEYQLTLAKAIEGTPILNSWEGSEENERLLRQAIAIYEQITAVEPENARFRSHYASCLHNLNIVLMQLGENDQARQLQVKWVEIAKRLWNDFPEKPAYGGDLGMAHMHLGISLWEAGERDAAIAEYESAVEVLQQAIKQGPEFPGYRNMLGFRVLNPLIQAYLQNGDFEKELAARKIQIQITEAGGREHGSHRAYWNNLVFFYGGMGENALLLGLDEEGDAAFDAQDRILREHFQNEDEKYDQLWCMRSMGRCSSFIQRGRMEEAREMAREIVDHFPLERIAVEFSGKSGSGYKDLAVFLATMPFDDLRRPHELASMLETSLQDPSQLEWDWSSLALLAASNAAGDYMGARQVLEQAEEHAGNPERADGMYSYFKFLGSQVLWNLGEKDSANRLFDEGLKFSDQFGNRGLGALIQREAAVLLGRDAQASATQDATSPLIQPNTQ